VITTSDTVVWLTERVSERVLTSFLSDFNDMYIRQFVSDMLYRSRRKPGFNYYTSTSMYHATDKHGIPA